MASRKLCQLCASDREKVLGWMRMLAAKDLSDQMIADLTPTQTILKRHKIVLSRKAIRHYRQQWQIPSKDEQRVA